MGKQDRGRIGALREAQAAIAARQRRKRTWTLAGGGVVIAALIVAIVVTLLGAVGRRPAGTATGPLVRPTSATEAGALTIGDPQAPVKVELFLDFMCPFCGRFERANGPELARLVRGGTVRLELYPLSFLDEASAGSEYSTRAANAVATVGDRAPDKLLAFQQALFDRQPAEGTRGPSDNQIAMRAREAGVPDLVVDAFRSRLFVPWIAASTEKAFAGGVSGTPTVRINGTKFEGDLYRMGPLTQAVTAAAAGRQ